MSMPLYCQRKCHQLISVVMCGLFSCITLSTQAQEKKSATPVQTVHLLITEQLDKHAQNKPLATSTQQLLDYLEKELKIKIVVDYYPWARVLLHGEQGLGLIYGISKTAERSKIFDFSDPVFTQKTWLVTLCDRQFPFEKVEDLKGKTISMHRLSSVSEEFDRHAGKLFKVDGEGASSEARLQKLLKHRSDAMVYYSILELSALQNKINLEYEISIRRPSTETQTYVNASALFCVLPKPIGTTAIHFAQSKKNDITLLHRINQALRRNRQIGQPTYTH